MSDHDRGTDQGAAGMLEETDALEDAYKRGRQSGIMDEREAAIKAGVYANGRYLSERYHSSEAVKLLHETGFCPICGTMDSW